MLQQLTLTEVRKQKKKLCDQPRKQKKEPCDQPCVDFYHDGPLPVQLRASTNSAGEPREKVAVTRRQSVLQRDVDHLYR